jgi:hypothetical protein
MRTALGACFRTIHRYPHRVGGGADPSCAQVRSDLRSVPVVSTAHRFQFCEDRGIIRHASRTVCSTSCCQFCTVCSDRV